MRFDDINIGARLRCDHLVEFLDQRAAFLVIHAFDRFGMIAENGLKLMLSLAGGLLQFILALVIAFFFYATGDVLAEHLERIIHRIAGERAPRLIEVTGATIRGTVYGILGTALVQGMLTAFGLWLSGVPRPLVGGATREVRK